MGMLSRIGGYLTPQRQMRKNALNEARMAYDAATRSRRSQGWRVVSTDANAELLGASSRLRDVARDMVRNVPLAARAKKVIAHNVVGSGIIPTISAGDERVKDRLEGLLKDHFDTTACDAYGRHDLYGLQNLAMGTIVESGEVLVRYRPRRKEDGLPLAFQLQVMEPDYLDSSVSGPQPNGNFAVQGIEFNGYGKIVAYHLFREHPGSMATFSLPVSDPVSAERVSHIFYTDRPGQARGVTWFAPVILRMRDKADFSDAHLIRQKVAACYAVFVRSTEGNDGIDSTKANPYPVESLEPGMIERLNDGEDVTFGSPPQVGDYGDYIKAHDREIAAALGISYEALTGDLSNVNFSSGRMGWLEMQRNIDAWRNFMLIPQMLNPIGQAFLNIASAAGTVGDATVQWTAPRREMINPSEEVKASRDAIRTGLSSRSNEQRKLGFDPVDLDTEIAADNQRADALSLIFDSDPRKVTSVGNPATQGQPAQ
ncbi:phage portal protein [Mesorhizobium sp. Root552]|uniref:phage portal protein n=1 Tax=Mesorhizobium sp. Root552 TaxID=1736555 RepID=UPI000A4239B1|nr:phage portal protein [Mesorhizobium sp. Root552]